MGTLGESLDGINGSDSVTDWVITFEMRHLAVFLTTGLRTSMKYFVILISVFFVTMKSMLALNYLMILLPQPPYAGITCIHHCSQIPL